MRRLEINFQQPPNPPRKTAGWFLLVTGMALLIEVGVSYERLESVRTNLNQEISASKLNLSMSHIELDSKTYTEKDYEWAKLIITRLSLPWEALFAGIESIKSDDVAILAIDPEIRTGLVSLQGEAKDYTSVLTLIAQLREIKPISQVFLLHHEMKNDDPQHPVRFTLSMRWTKQ